METNVEKQTDLHRSYQRNMLLLLLLTLLVSLGWLFFMFYPTPEQGALMTIGPVQMDKGEYCPGETMTYTYTVDVREMGVYMFDVAVWRVTPPSIVVFNESRRVVAARPEAWRIVREWRIPEEYYNPRTDTLVEWQPGQYERHMAVTPSGRNALPSTGIIPFTIRGGCKNEQ